MLPQEGVPPFQSVHIAFAEEHSASFVSGFGHLFVCLPEAEVKSTEDLLGSTAVNFGADTSPLGEGMWVGDYKLQSCHELVRKNTHFDQRRITFFELSLTPVELANLREDLERRMRKSYRYDFLRHNCAHYIWDWLEGPVYREVSLLYLTPREALGRILSHYPPCRIRVLRSDLEILELYLEGLPGEEQAEVVRALVDPDALHGIQDRVLRLLTIKVAESRARRGEYERFQEARAEILRAEEGAEDAKRVVAFQERVQEQVGLSWTEESEGPALSIGMIHHKDLGATGMRVHFEAGLRDSHTSPEPEHVLKEVKLLSSTLDAIEGNLKGDVILISLSTLRDATSLSRGASSGASAGYIGLPNSLGSSGLHLSTWAGFSAKLDQGWVGGRLSAVVDELEGKAGMLIYPGMTWDMKMADFVAHCEVNYDFCEGFGLLARQDLILSNSATLRASWVHSPFGEEVLMFGFQFRF